MLNALSHKHLQHPGSLDFFIFSLFLVNGPQTIYVIRGCFKCISGRNLSPAIKNCLLLHSFYAFKTKQDLTKEFELKEFLFLA